MRCRPDRREEDEALDARVLRRLQQPQRAEPVDLLDAAVLLVADRRRQVDDRVDASHRVTHRPRLSEVAESELDVDPLGAQPARVTHQRTHLVPRGQQLRQQRRSHRSRGAGDENHRRNPR
jgi:hypothetical protein